MEKTIGIIGGGQLGRMLAIAAKKLGFITIILDPTPNSPAGQVADRQIIGSFKDEAKIKELASQVRYLTFEIELANADILIELAHDGVIINPSPSTLAIIKDKFAQKQFLRKTHIATADFFAVGTKEDILLAVKDFGYPFLLKARFDAYDGRGNALITSESDIDKGLKKLEGRKLYVEKFVPFVKEVAIMVAKNTVGEIAAYPLVETTHQNNICHTVVAPATVSDTVRDIARRRAIQVIEHLGGAGVFGVEMFVTDDEKVLVNEISPRVHNSGHYTLEACRTSQFEQHIRAITGMELGSTEMIVPAAAMVNILGDHEGAAKPKGDEMAKEIAGVEVHLYGKAETKIERKMGHITAVGQTVAEALTKALKAREYITI